MCTKKWRDVSYEDRLKLMNIDTLWSRRLQLKLCYLYKILNGQAYFINSPLTLFSPTYNTRSHNLILNVAFTWSANSFNLFFLSNSMDVEQPLDIVSNQTFLSFKKALCNHTLDWVLYTVYFVFTVYSVFCVFVLLLVWSYHCITHNIINISLVQLFIKFCLVWVLTCVSISFAICASLS